MASLCYAVSVVDALKVRIDFEIKNAASAPPLTDTQKTESELAKMGAIRAVESTIVAVDNTLLKLQGQSPARSKPASAAPSTTKPKSTVTRRSLLRGGPPILDDENNNNNKNKAKEVWAQMSPKGISTVTATLQQMASSITPIVTSFDKVLVEPYLDQHNAQLNIVPVVGIKNNKIMYIDTKLNGSGGVTEAWAMFSKLPEGVTVAPDAKNVFMFPFEGDFCLAIGQKVWRKAHCPNTEEDRAKAVDHWPNLYRDGWTKVGDSVLPSADLRGVVPFATLTADRRNLDFNLVVLKSDSSLHFLDSNQTLGDNAPFLPLAFADSAGLGVAPKFMYVAYWNNQIVAYDDANNVWNVTVNFTAKTFSVADKRPDKAITELTATEVGPVTVTGDGYLYKRVVSVTDADAHSNSKRWISQDGVSHLGVASPGVILDLNLLTRTLRSRYIETQTALYPVVNKMSAYCQTHNKFLDNVRQQFDDYNNAIGDGEKQTIAVKQAKAFLGSAKTWGSILGESTRAAFGSVSIMTSQLSDVQSQLKVQLQTLKDKLAGLMEVLKSEKETLKKLEAAFFASIVVALVGVAMMVLSSGTMAAIGGALFLGGLVAAISFGKKMVEMIQEIQMTQSQIDAQTRAIAELTTIVGNYDDLQAKYQVLNTFWGRMSNDASSIQTMDDVVLEEIGLSIFEDYSSIDASQEATTTMKDACQTYLDVLNKQGIKLPTETLKLSVTARLLLKAHTVTSSEDKAMLHAHAVFHHHVDRAIEKLGTGGYEGYLQEMDHARAVSSAASVAASDLKLRTGLWFDIPALNASGALWAGSRLPNVHALVALGSTNEEISDAHAQMSGSLEAAKPFVVAMVQRTVALATAVLEWSRKDPAAADAVAAARQECGAGLSSAAMAKNKFSDFQEHATAFQQGREADINGKLDEIKAEQARASAAMNNLSVPNWEILLMEGMAATGIAPQALTEYRDAQWAKIQSESKRRLDEINAQINSLREMQQSGIAFQASSLTWIQMCENVSGNLGSIYNILSAIDGQVLENNNEYYSEIMEVEWQNIVKDADRVLDLLDVHTPLTISSHLVPSGKLQSRKARTRLAAATVADGASSSLLSALCPGATVGTSLHSQVDSGVKVFNALNGITQIPFVSGLVAYWDGGSDAKTTLLDVTNLLLNEYVHLAAREYKAVEQLHSYSGLYVRRAPMVASGKMKVDVFVKLTYSSVDTVYQAADRAWTTVENAASGFDDTMELVSENLKDIQKLVSKLDVDISKLGTKEKEMVYKYIADVITKSVSSVGAFLPKDPKSESETSTEEKKKVPPSITSIVQDAAKMGATAYTMADNLQREIKDLKIDEVVQIIHTMKLVKRDCETTAQQLTMVRPLFHLLVDGLKDLTTSLKDSRDELQKILQNVPVVGQYDLSAADAKRIGDEWQKVETVSQNWLDLINSQNISPLTFSVRAPATRRP